jgi:hypothetical protein
MRDLNALVAAWDARVGKLTPIAEVSADAVELAAKTVIEGDAGTLWLSATEYNGEGKARSVLLSSTDAGKRWQRTVLNTFAPIWQRQTPVLRKVDEAIYLEASLDSARTNPGDNFQEREVYEVVADAELHKLGTTPGRTGFTMLSRDHWIRYERNYVSEFFVSQDRGSTWRSVALPESVGPLYVAEVVGTRAGHFVVGLQYDKIRKQTKWVTLAYDQRMRLTTQQTFEPSDRPEAMPRYVRYDEQRKRLWVIGTEQSAGAYGFVAYSDDNGQRWTVAPRFQAQQPSFTSLMALALDPEGAAIIAGQSSVNPKSPKEVCAAALRYVPAVSSSS